MTNCIFTRARELAYQSRGRLTEHEALKELQRRSVESRRRKRSVLKLTKEDRHVIDQVQDHYWWND